MTPAIPSVQHSFPGVVVHHGVVAVLIGELYVGIPLFSSFGVVSKVDGSGLAAVTINSVDHSIGDKSISHRPHFLCRGKRKSYNATEQYNKLNEVEPKYCHNLWRLNLGLV